MPGSIRIQEKELRFRATREVKLLYQLEERFTSQIDIIIYTNNLPLLFHEGDFIITTPQNVVAIIKVKSKMYKAKIGKIVEKANANGKIICSKSECGIFNL